MLKSRKALALGGVHMEELYDKKFTNAKILKSHLEDMKIVGHKIVDMRFIGYCYNFAEDSIEDSIYDYYISNGYDEKSAQEKSEYNNIDENCEASFSLFAQIDEPALLKLDNNDILAIDAPFEGKYCVAKNIVDWNRSADINYANCYANLLFASILGKTITSVRVNTDDKERSSIIKIDEIDKENIISSVDIIFEDNSYLKFAAWIDFCNVLGFDSNGELIDISFKELKKCLF